jgi:hypothetical protein
MKRKKVEVKATNKIISNTSKARVKASTRPKIEEEVKANQKRVEDDYKSVVFREYMRKRRLEEEAEDLEK